LRGLEASPTMRSEGWSIGKFDLGSKVCLRLVRTPVTLLKSGIVSESMVNEPIEGLFDGSGLVSWLEEAALWMRGLLEWRHQCPNSGLWPHSSPNMRSHAKSVDFHRSLLTPQKQGKRK